MFKKISYTLLSTFLFAINTTLTSMLIISVLLYFYAESWLGVKPFTPSELLMWFSDLRATERTALLSSLLTVAGFLVAFATASYSWKAKTLAEIKIKTADDIDESFTRCTTLINKCHLYVDFLINYKEKERQYDDYEKTSFFNQHNSEIMPNFLRNREELKELYFTSYHLQSKHCTILALQPYILNSNMTKAIQSLKVICQNIDFALPKRVLTPDQFLSVVDFEMVKRFKIDINNNHLPFNEAAGAIRGALLSDITGFNLGLIVSLITLRK